MQFTPEVIRMLGGLLERKVTRDDPELATAMASLTVSEKVRIKQSRRQHKKNERDCRTVVQQLDPQFLKNGAPDKEELEKDSYQILRQY